MTAYIQSLLFEPNNMKYPNILDNVSELMLSDQMKKKYLKDSDICDSSDNDEKIQNEVSHDSDRDYIKPKQKDSLFWCLFIAKHGYKEYLEIQNHYGSKQLDIQKEISQYIKENPTLLKGLNVRITKALVQEIISDLLTEIKKTTIYVLYSYAFYFHMNIVLIHPNEKCYLKVFSENDNFDNPIIVLKKNEDEQYLLKDKELSAAEFTELTNNLFCIENHVRPLKAISNYKVEELEIIAEQLDIDLDERKWKKQDLYNEITKLTKWY